MGRRDRDTGWTVHAASVSGDQAAVWFGIKPAVDDDLKVVNPNTPVSSRPTVSTRPAMIHRITSHLFAASASPHRLSGLQ